ncbi:MAG: hypothetical protein S4CHLAM123_04770 [Chlamydiales bacterium]|nr:hypothetical protein [Chlamydiales bacterium]
MNTTPSQLYMLSSIPAIWIDDLIRYSPEFGCTRSPKLGGARALSLLVSVTVLPVFMSLDCIHYTGKLAATRFSNWKQPDANKEALIKEYEYVILKCLRGLVTFLASVRFRDVVSNHFLPESVPDGKIHPTGGLYTGKAQIYTPTNEKEVAQHIYWAKQHNQKVSIAGSGFCQGKQTLPPGENNIHLNMSQLNSVEIDPNNMTAKVGSGATWSAIQQKANKVGLAVQVMQASNVFSVGGSLSANCHGWDHTQGTLANTIESIKIVDPEGKFQTLTPEDELFQFVVGGYGLFGVMVEITLKLTNNQELFDYGEKVEIDQYVEYFNKLQANNNIKMHLYRLGLKPGNLLGEGWAQNYSTQGEVLPSLNLEDENIRGTLKDRIYMQIARNSRMARKYFWKMEKKDLQTIKKSTRNAIMRPKINAVFVNNSSAHQEWLQEYFVPAEHLAEFIKFLGQELDANEVALFNASVRFVKQDKLAKMGYATEGDRFAVVLFFNQSLNKDELSKTKNWVQKIVDKLIEMNGSFYLPYAHLATQEQFQKCYPNWQEIQTKKQEYDPNERFSNGLYQDYFTKEAQS